MVERQLRARGIDDPRVLRAMGKVPREKFVPKELVNKAYDDRPLPIGYGQTISQPFIVGFMTLQLQPKTTDRVLEIGTGSGYQAAVLGELVAEVYTIEIVRPLAQQAEGVLREMGYKNVHVKAGDGYKGWPEHAPFDAIIVTAAPDHVPQPLVEQLKEGGRLIIPVGKYPAQRLYTYEKRGAHLKETAVMPVRFVPLTRDRE
jgi:protein-L-isoaspartate(D-aspartate) O-methyltransferase